MDSYYILSIFVLAIICIILFTKYTIEKDRNKYQSGVIEKSDNVVLENQNLKKEILKLKEANFEAYKEGIEKGQNITNFKIQIHPYQEIIKNKKLIGSEEIIKIGYKYMLLINDVPCLNTHIEILETISKKEVNEERINAILNKISEISNLIPNGNVQIIGSLTEFGKRLLSQLKN